MVSGKRESEIEIERSGEEVKELGESGRHTEKHYRPVQVAGASAATAIIHNIVAA